MIFELQGKLTLEQFRALSRLTEMGSQEWVERGMGLEQRGGKSEKDSFLKVRSRQMEDSM